MATRKKTAGRPRENKPKKDRSALGKRFAKRLFELRESRGFSQDQLSKRSGVAQRFISKIESGQAEAGLPTIEKLSTALGVRALDMLS